jgi:hypothetical protein
VINAGWNGTGGTFDQNYYSLGSRLNARIANPFKGLIPQPSSLTGDTITVAQLLMPYPEFGNIATDLAGNCFMCIDQNHVLLFWLQVVSAIALPNRSTTSLSYRTAV